jgi:hypothetical protein
MKGKRLSRSRPTRFGPSPEHEVIPLPEPLKLPSGKSITEIPVSKCILAVAPCCSLLLPGCGLLSVTTELAQRVPLWPSAEIYSRMSRSGVQETTSRRAENALNAGRVHRSTAPSPSVTPTFPFPPFLRHNDNSKALFRYHSNLDTSQAKLNTHIFYWNEAHICTMPRRVTVLRPSRVCLADRHGSVFVLSFFASVQWILVRDADGGEFSAQ